ncbi:MULTISPECIES: DUF5682 family protein [unclassified Paenibacillus]|uniref:DUF5682 family protein n=1 Tax=unclassified Paenibacillus TaxID=185978 RepID=UPI00070AC4AA|nr:MULTISPECIES: DUF5682 family protein [unclassified Paenibacillus]KQX45803.1 hypothetical protein ASD40_18305 [Paenibacillus sp. Root444D2]KRE50757.1 hypothetical protein ASG85_19515 [Paenibacillus sp. Soil724D2]
MEKSVLRVLGDEQLDRSQGFHVFGIRHLSPAGAFHLLAFLDEVKPTAVLVEGPSDASGFITELTSHGVVPPIAILAYTDQLPVRTLLYPYADYSPEYQAFQWASRNGSQAEFIDLPSEHALAIYEQRKRRSTSAEGESNQSEVDDFQAYVLGQRTLYQQLAELSEEPDYEAYWERHFEHNLQKDAYRHGIYQFSAQMRELTAQQEWQFAPQEAAYNEIREAYMRRRIQDAIEAGHAPEKIVVVTGAHHASALDFRFPVMTDEEMKGLPKTTTKITLMPYSYYKLSSHSGYGAGNQAPAYFELFWQCLQKGDLSRLPSLYFSQVAAYLREHGTYRSTASLIEGVRLAEALAALHEGNHPTWKDLRDAAMVCLGHGELSTIVEALARTDVGTAIGRLPEGVSQTPIQDDLNRELKRLKLEKFKSTVASTLELDLRENRRVKSEEAAFLDLKRSVLLHRLELLGINFAKKQRVNQDSASWAENWVLQWTPEAEIQAVESTLKGETIELAAAFVLKERLDVCSDIAEASRIIRVACDCTLTELMEQAKSMLQGLAVDAGNFEQVAGAAYELSVMIRYGSIRRIETDTLVPLLQQLFLRGTLLLVDSAGCNDDAAQGMVRAIQSLHTIAQDHFEAVDDALWLNKLQELASRDDRNAKLSGFAFAILLERNEIPDERVAMEVSRRLSPGIPVDLGAGWFEGMSMRNRYALLSRVSLWQQLDAYIGSLDKEAFQRSLVFLRRAFGSFEPREKATVAEMMGNIWGVGADNAGTALQQPLSEEEKEKLDELNDFDFGDL